MRALQKNTPTASHASGQGMQTLHIHTAYRWDQRLKGLLGTNELAPDHALHIRPCNSVHTVGMRYAIDVVFLSREGRILKIVQNLQPNRAAACWKADSAMELAAGRAEDLGLRVGQRWRHGHA